MTINELWGEAYNEAITEVMDILNDELGTNLLFTRIADANAVHEVILGLNIKFTENGEII